MFQIIKLNLKLMLLLIMVPSPEAKCNINARAFELQTLKAHNEIRERHGAPPLVLDTNLLATERAEKYSRAIMDNINQRHLDAPKAIKEPFDIQTDDTFGILAMMLTF